VFSLDEDTMTFGEHGSTAEANRAVSTTRVREFRQRQKLGPPGAHNPHQSAAGGQADRAGLPGFQQSGR
jgi:hypothetical protein